MSGTSDSSRSFGRPALTRLEKHHDELVAELRDGFTSLDEVIFWSQRLSVRTLGVLDDHLFRRIGNDRVLWTTLITTEKRTEFRPSAPPPESAQEMRYLFEVEYVLPATRKAFRRLRKSAGEYFDEEEAIAVAGKEFIAMRPALNHLEERQREILMELLDGGIDGGRSDLLDWLRDLTGASFGQIDGSLQTRAYKEEVTSQVLQGESANPEAGRLARQKLAFTYLLPAFNSGTRKLIGKAGENTTGEGATEGGSGEHIDV